MEGKKKQSKSLWTVKLVDEGGEEAPPPPLLIKNVCCICFCLSQVDEDEEVVGFHSFHRFSLLVFVVSGHELLEQRRLIVVFLLLLFIFSLFLVLTNLRRLLYVSLGSSLQDMSNSRFWLSITCN